MKQPDFSQFPILSTQRFTLRFLSLEDTAAIYQLRSEPKVAHLTGRKPVISMDEASAYIEKIDGLIRRTNVYFGESPIKISKSFKLTSNHYGHTHTEVAAMLTYIISSES